MPEHGWAGTIAHANDVAGAHPLVARLALRTGGSVAGVKPTLAFFLVKEALIAEGGRDAGAPCRKKRISGVPGRQMA